MPHNSGHRRSRSGTYFSGFTRVVAQLQGQPISSKARSSEKLSELLVEPCKRSHSERELSKESPHWKGFQACKVRIEHELELQVQSLLGHKRYREVTIPTSIKFSVSREAPGQQQAAVMARPRSPTSRDTDFLDQTLLSIRKKLTALSNDRLEMENKMEELMSGIKTIHAQHQCKRQHSQSDLYSSIRRVRSSATAAMRPSNLDITASSKDKTPDNLSQEPDSPDLSQDSTLSATSQNSPPMMRQRSASAAASIRFKPSKPSPISLSSALSCGNVEEEHWLPVTTIHELPESPTYVSTTSLSNSSSSLHCYSIHSTAPRGAYRRSVSVSSPPSSSSSGANHRSPTALLTSTPNISQPYEKEHYHTLPNFSLHRNTLSERVINSSIPEDEVDYASVTDSLSQLSTCTDEGSPKNNGSTIITRRSSLTGQIEHYRRPRLLTKKKDLLTKKISLPLDMATRKMQPNEEASAKKEGLINPSLRTSSGSKDSGYKVLNKGRKSKRSSHRISVFLPSIETTV